MRVRSRAGVAIAAVAAVVVIGGIALAARPSGQAADPGAPAVAPAAQQSANPPEDVSAPTSSQRLAEGTGGRMVDRDGLTVYTFSADQPGVSHCTGACSTTWSPVRSAGGKPQATGGLPISAVGSIQRADGTEQVTLYGWPLYHYAGDTAAGAATGDGRTAFGGRWSATAPAPPAGSAPAATATAAVGTP